MCASYAPLVDGQVVMVKSESITNHKCISFIRNLMRFSAIYKRVDDRAILKQKYLIRNRKIIFVVAESSTAINVSLK